MTLESKINEIINRLEEVSSISESHDRDSELNDIYAEIISEHYCESSTYIISEKLNELLSENELSGYRASVRNIQDVGIMDTRDVRVFKRSLETLLSQL